MGEYLIRNQIISKHTMEHQLMDIPELTLYQPMTHICVISSDKPIRMYIGVLILGVNTLYRLFCFFKLFPMVGKGLRTSTV